MPLLSTITCAVLLVGLLAAAPAAAERTITDSAGRQVAVPDRIERVFAAGPPASVLLYVLAPERMIGWPRAPRPEELPYIAPDYRDLPEVGWLTGRGDTANLEVVLQARPDLILDFGSVRATYVSLAERVQAQTGIPYLLIDGTFANTADAVRLLGAVLGVEERAERIATYVETTFAEIDATLAEVPQEQRPRVYLARGPSGLETGLQGSINTEIIERVGAINVAAGPERRQARHRRGVDRADRGLEPRHRDHLGPELLRGRLEGLLLAGGRGGRGRPGLSQPVRAVRLDRPAALAQPADRR